MSEKSEQNRSKTDVASIQVKPFLEGRIPNKISLFDTTLRDGEQTPGMTLTPEDKISLAQALDALGVDMIEAGFAAVSEIDSETIKSIVNLGLKAEIYSLARSSKKDIDAAVRSGVSNVHLFIATSDIHLKHKLNISREEALSKAVEAVKYAKSLGLKVQFSCEDATRTDIDYLLKVFKAVEEAGADSLNIPDTVGVAVPESISSIVSKVVSNTELPVSVHCHNDMGLALANTLASLEAGAVIAHVTMNGIGERTGNVALEEVAVNLYKNYGVSTVDLSMIHKTSRIVERTTGMNLAINKAIVGRNAFSHESGIHVHGILNESSTYEPFCPELIGADRQIVIGRLSGEHSLKSQMNEINPDFPDDLIPQLTEAVKVLSFGGKEIDKSELFVLSEQILWKGKSIDKIILENYSITTGKDVLPKAEVTLNVDGVIRTASEAGVGPVNAALGAIGKAINEDLALDDFNLKAVTGKEDSLAQVTVVLRDVSENGTTSVGRAVSSDIVKASIDAMMEAVNRGYARKSEQ